MTIFFAVLISYMLGSIPFGLLLTRAAGLGDIRDIGSGNIGATNVLRTGNKKIAAATLFFDGLKGAAAVLIVGHFAPEFISVAGICALLGHIFPLWLKFKGGKGVATGLGVMLAVAWPVGLILLVMWVLVAKSLHISSLAALVAVGFTPIDVVVCGRTDLVPFSLVLLALIFFTHRDNIRRLLSHGEPKIGQNAKSARASPPSAGA